MREIPIYFFPILSAAAAKVTDRRFVVFPILRRSTRTVNLAGFSPLPEATLATLKITPAATLISFVDTFLSSFRVCFAEASVSAAIHLNWFL